MGALHDGHLSLVGIAKKHADVVVASVFVNPKQFGEGEDLSAYPRDLEADANRLEAAGCDVVFAPSVESVYPPDFQTLVRVSEVARGLEGDHRPGHFEGVATVVLRLFGLVKPDVAVFGEKDFQQLTLVRTMTRDLSLDIEIVGAPLVRDHDGLALSSRNAYLTPDQRAKGLSLSRGLRRAELAYRAGEREGWRLLQPVQEELHRSGLRPDYLELRGFTSLEPLARADQPAAILVAAKVGRTRLLDNVILSRPE